MELLSSKLQDPSNTVKMVTKMRIYWGNPLWYFSILIYKSCFPPLLQRALCAVACLMTSDLLSLEQMFGVTQRRLRQLSEAPPGPVANKATKVRDTERESNTYTTQYFFCLLISSYQILRQFEALMGGTLQTPKQDTANSSQHPTTNQFPTSTYTDPLLPIHSAYTDAKLNLYQPDILPKGITQPPDHPASPSRQALAQRDSSGELVKDTGEGKLSHIQQEPVRTAEVKLAAEDPELLTDRRSTPLSETESNQAHPSRPSLFSGMELVTKGRPLCERETSLTETGTMSDDFKENPAVHSSDSPVNFTFISKTSDSVASDSSQPVSAFSFLNFWPLTNFFLQLELLLLNQWCHHVYHFRNESIRLGEERDSIL